MVGPTVSMFDIHAPCMPTYGPRYIPSKNIFAYLGKFPLGAGFIPIFGREFYMELSHPPFPPPSRAQSNELPSNEPRCIVKAHAISRFLGLELRCS